MTQYFSVVTLSGQAKVADAIAGGAAVNIIELSVGDGNGAAVTPLETQAALVHEVWRGAVASCSRDPLNPTHVIVQALIPVGAGPFTVRELALWTSDGQCFAVMNSPEIVKTTAAQGATQDVTVSFRIVVDTAANITVTVDPAQLISVSGLLRAPHIAVDGFVAGPPADPDVGDLYVVSAAPTGAFVGLAHKFVQWNGTVWVNAVACKETIVGDGSTGRYWRRTATGWDEIYLDIWIKQDMVLTVGPGQQHATIQGALDALKYKLIAPYITVTLLLTAGQHTITSSISLNHLSSANIVIEGAAMTGAFPTRANIVASAATTLATLRTKWATEIICDNCNGFNAPRARLLKLKNLLITGSGGYSSIVVGNTPTAPLSTPIVGTEFFGSGQLTAINCWAHNMGTGFWACQHSNLNLSKCGTSHMSKAGFAVENGSVLAGQWIMSCRNTDRTLMINSSSYAEIYGFVLADNAGTGVFATYGSEGFLAGDGAGWKEVAGNGSACVISDRGSFVEVLNSEIAGLANGACTANNGSSITALAASNTITGTLSPAANTVGNSNSFIRN